LLSAFLENPHYANLPNISVSITAVESSSALLGVLALGLPQNEVFDGDRIISAHNGYNKTILPQNKVFERILAHDGYNATVLPCPGIISL